MKKKLVACLMVAFMSLAVVGCGQKETAKDTNTNEVTEEETQEVTENVSESEEPTEEVSQETTEEMSKTEELTAETTELENNDERDAEVSEESAGEEQTSVSESETYPGADVVKIVNLKGDTATVYKLADGRYMDRIDRIFIFNGTDTWTDEDGVEWNEAVN